jgi:predicted aspartyl protease
VVDTGADRTVIADNVAAALGATAGTSVMVEGVVRTVRADTVQVRKIAAGSVERRDFEVPVLPRAQLMADGYLGLDVIDGYRVSRGPPN